MRKEREKELKAFKLMIDEAAFFEFKALQKQLKHCYSFPILPHAPLSSTWPDLVFNWAHWAVYPCWCHQKSPTMPHLLNLGRLFNRQLSPILPEGLASDFISSYSLLERFPVVVPMPVTTTDYRGRRKEKDSKNTVEFSGTCQEFLWQIISEVTLPEFQPHGVWHLFCTSSEWCSTLGCTNVI